MTTREPGTSTTRPTGEMTLPELNAAMADVAARLASTACGTAGHRHLEHRRQQLTREQQARTSLIKSLSDPAARQHLGSGT